ncbi:MAG: hypothetical protein V4603_07440 [Pseudomonadota bacterium]
MAALTLTVDGKVHIFAPGLTITHVVFAANGVRIRRTPFTPALVKAVPSP